MRRLLFLLYLLPSVACADPATFDEFEWLWEYSPDRIDLTYPALFGTRGDFEDWATQARGYYAARLAEVQIPEPVLTPDEIRDKDGYTVQKFTSPEGDSLLAIPDAVDPDKPVIIALHGHEEPHRGNAPWALFDDWAGQFAADGYVVWAPSHLWYDRPLQSNAHHVDWTARVSALLDAAMPLFPAHEGLAVVGLSSGGMTASFLMAARGDIDAGVFAGTLSALDFFRENYRIEGHPDQWDVPWLNSYTAVYALIAPRPAQWQLGKADSFWPKVNPPVPTTERNPGFPRNPIADEVWGQFLILERIWSHYGARPDLRVHEGGHVLDYRAARGFIEGCF